MAGDATMNLKAPRPPPFPVGTRLRLVKAGPSFVKVGDEVTVVRVKPGRRGTGRLMEVQDDGYEVYDETSDGYSVYEVRPSDTVYGRCLYARDASEWEVVP